MEDRGRMEGVASEGRRCKASRLLWAGAGLACFGLGLLGAVVPVFPTTPFLLMAAFCFARGSRRLNDWFESTKLYRNVVEGFATRRRMTVKAKLTVLIPVTVVLGISFALMVEVPIGRVCVAAVWAAHVLYFGFVVKTERRYRGVGEDETTGERSLSRTVVKPAAADRTEA